MKSCWGGTTEQDAIDVRYNTGYDRLEDYHNKLILENPDRTLTEVLDSPCKRLDIWEKCMNLRDKNEKVSS